MRGLAQFRWYTFGDKFLYRKSGIPIGGPVSGAVLEAALSVDEDSFDKFGWKTYSAKLGIGGKREQWATIVRYVDDVLIISQRFCPN